MLKPGFLFRFRLHVVPTCIQDHGLVSEMVCGGGGGGGGGSDHGLVSDMVCGGDGGGGSGVVVLLCCCSIFRI